MWYKNTEEFKELNRAIKKLEKITGLKFNLDKEKAEIFFSARKKNKKYGKTIPVASNLPESEG